MSTVQKRKTISKKLKSIPRPTYKSIREGLKAHPAKDRTPYQQSLLTFPANWRSRRKKARIATGLNPHPSPLHTIQLQFLKKDLACSQPRIPLLVNLNELEADLAIANGNRKTRGVLHLDEALELGLGGAATNDFDVFVLLASPIRHGRLVPSVTCVVIIKLVKEGKVLGYASAVPKWFPLLAGHAYEAFGTHELASFFPAAERRLNDYYSAERAKALAVEKRLVPFETTLQLR